MPGTVLTPISWLDRRDRIRWFLLVPIVSLAALIEAAGALAVFGLLRLVVDPSRIASTPVVSDLWPERAQQDPVQLIGVLTGVVAGFYLIRAAFLIWTEWLKHDVIYRSAAHAAERLFGRYLAADYVFHLRRRSVSLIEELSRSAEIAYQLVSAAALNVMAESATILALVVALLVTTPAGAIAAVAVVLAAGAVPLLTTRRLWTAWGEEIRSLEERQLHVLQQSLGAIKEVTVSGRQAFFEERFRHTRRALSAVRRRTSVASSALRTGLETLLILCMLLVVYLVTRERSGPDTVSILALFAYAGFRVVPSANRILLNVGLLREGTAFVRSMDADFRALPPPAAEPHARTTPVKFEHALGCDHVTLEYEPGRPALIDVSLEIRRGESIGIVGPTGAGKSSLVDVLLGLLRPTRGLVTVDGEDLAGRERGWLTQVGYVPQDPYLLDDTIRRNIAFGIPDALIDDDRVARAVELAQLDDVVKQKPEGLDADLGENGVRLSGGQRQRVAIARALYSDPAVLVLDEATAALDTATEREVTRAIAALQGTRTLIVIAHRLSTVRACDRLVYLREGRIVGVGAYDELLDDPSFRALAIP